MSLRIALVGYGKMGKAIEAEALERGHVISAKINSGNKSEIANIHSSHTDVAIEFTNPESAIGNFSALIQSGVPVVTGTTGWNAQREAIQQLVEVNKAAFLFGSNFSPGVNIFFKLNEFLARMMNRFPEYSVLVKEMHHVHKKDAPGGTAITLASQIIHNLERKENWIASESGPGESEEAVLPIVWKREGEVPGTHEIIYTSLVDQLSMRHEAFNRRGFALGAVMAAEWLHGKKGFYDFQDIFELI